MDVSTSTMNWRRYFLEITGLVIAALLCAIVANAIAARERKLALVGNYPNALRVPSQTTDSAPATVPAIADASTAPAPVDPPLTGTAVTQTAAVTSTAPVAPATATAAPAVSGTPTPAPAAPAAAAKPDLSRFKPHPDKASLDLSHADVAALHAGGALFLDARRTALYEQGHIAGARSVSVWESDVDQKVAGLYEERSDPAQQELPIVIYCSGGDCEDSHTLAQKLWGLQFNNLYVYKDGYPDWVKRGGAVRTGSNP